MAVHLSGDAARDHLARYASSATKHHSAETGTRSTVDGAGSGTIGQPRCVPGGSPQWLGRGQAENRAEQHRVHR